MRNEYNVLVPDIPGSGDRAELKNKTNDGYADWLHQYIAAQKFTQKPIIIGHSMGSILTSNFIRKYPNDIDQRVIYLSPILRDRKAKKRSIYSSFRQNQTKIHWPATLSLFWSFFITQIFYCWHENFHVWNYLANR